MDPGVEDGRVERVPVLRAWELDALDVARRRLQVEVDWTEAPGTEMMSAVMRDIAWLEQNICSVVGVAGALAVCLIIIIHIFKLLLIVFKFLDIPN